ncbi:MAG TPA: DegV family protein [Pseudothermotoga sp.]|uniref:DegV family protein n=1 Tax=Thermotoga profunda TaxID=1508420 RepID=UPI000596E2A9|nr:DegV family protein [Thermotoga profunda]
MSVAIVVDSSMDYPSEYKWQLPVHILPLRLYVDEREYRDRYDIDERQIYQYMIDGKRVKTALPNVKETAELLSELCKKYGKVIVLTLSQKLSGTFNMIRMVVENFNLNKKVDVYDSRGVSGKIFYVLDKLINDLLNNRKICQEAIDEYSRNSTMFFVLNTLEYLKKGGRIGKLSAFIGKILNIKPILSLDEKGELYKVATARNDKDLVSTMVSLIKDFIGSEKNYVLYGGYGLDSMKDLLQDVISKFNRCDGLARVGPAVAAHAGPEVFGILVGKA